MESEGLLDIGNDVHLFALRYVFKERINNGLKVFAEGWNHHPLSTEGNMSPAQLWVWGLRHVGSSQLIFVFVDVTLAIFASNK